MAVQEIKIKPSQSGYAVEFANNTISTKLDGGRSRFRLNQKNGVSLVNVEYDLNKSDYQYLWAFYRDSTQRGSLPFQSYLYLNSNELTLHVCKFVPGSVRLLSQSGDRFIVGATIEALESA